MYSRNLSLDTSRSRVTDLTAEIESFLQGQSDGLLSVFAPHSTVGVAIIEMGSGSDTDLEAAIARLLPRDDSFYRHAHGAKGHGADHVLPAFISPSVTIPVEAGRACLGTWQSVVLVDLNTDNPTRQVRLSFLPG